MNARLTICAVGLIATLVVGGAAARGESRAIWFEGPVPTCPAPSEASARIETAMTTALGQPVPAALQARITVTPQGRELVLVARIRIDDTEGERQLRGTNCIELIDAIALVLVMTAETLRATSGDSDSQGHDPGGIGDGERPPAANLGDTAPLEDRPLPPPRRPRRIGVGIGALAGANLGVAPALSPWFGAHLSVSDGPYAAELVAGFAPESTAFLTTDPTRGATLRYTQATARLCRHLGALTTAQVSGCLGLSGSLLLWTGFGFSTPAEPATAAGFSGDLAALAHLPLSNGLSVRFDITFSIGLARSRAVFVDEGAPAGAERIPIHTTAPVTGTATLGLAYQLR